MAEAARSMGCKAGKLVDGHRIRLLPVVEVFTLESQAIQFGPQLWAGKYAAELANRG